MQRMFDHINAFAELMKQKGYDGYYQSTFDFNDKLKDNLIKHVFQCHEERKDVAPLNLSTYSHWTDNKSPYVRCNFHVDFSEPKGFNVTKMNIEYGDEYGILRNKEIPVTSNSEIPDRVAANNMMMEKKKAMRI